MLKISTDFNALKTNEERWEILKSGVSLVINKHSNNSRSLQMMLQGNPTFQVIFFTESITAVGLLLMGFRSEDHPEENGYFKKEDFLTLMHEYKDFLSFLLTQLVLDLQGDWKDRLQDEARKSVEEGQEENDT